MLAEDLDLLAQEFQKVLRQAQGEPNSEEKLENLLKGLLTPKEIEEFAERIRIVQLLKKGIGQHQIAARLKIGVATVTRGSKEIQEGNFKYV